MTRSLRAALDEANPNKTDAALHAVLVGSGLALVPRYVRGAVAADRFVLPDGSRAIAALYVFALSGGAPGLLIVDGVFAGTPPAAGHVMVDLDGALVFAAADAHTAVEAVIVAVEGDIFSETILTPADIGTLLGARAAIFVLSCSARAAGVDVPVVQIERGGAPAAGEFALSALGTTVVFAAADNIDDCTVRYIAAPGVPAGQRPSFGARLDAQGNI